MTTGLWINRELFDANREDAVRQAQAIAAFVAAETGTPLADILGPRRHARIVRWRAAIAWLARRTVFVEPCSADAKRQPISYPLIGAALGREYSTVSHAKDVAERLRERDPEFRALTDRWRAELRENGSAVMSAGDPPGRAPITRPFALAMTAIRKPKNDLSPDDGGALNRLRGSVRLIEALRREFPGRCEAA